MKKKRNQSQSWIPDLAIWDAAEKMKMRMRRRKTKKTIRRRKMMMMIMMMVMMMRREWVAGRVATISARPPVRDQL